MWEPVPGCSGDGLGSVDYCTRPVGGQVVVAQFYSSNGGTAEIVNTGLDLEVLSADPTSPLGLCQGDCDTDGKFCRAIFQCSWNTTNTFGAFAGR